MLFEARGDLWLLGTGAEAPRNLTATSGTFEREAAVTPDGRSVAYWSDADGEYQLYIRDLVGSITRPVKELKGFQKIFLKAGESKTVTFNITTNDLKFYNSELKYDWEPGEFVIMVGGNSKDIKSAKVNWIKAP